MEWIQRDCVSSQSHTIFSNDSHPVDRDSWSISYRKIPKISPEAYIFQRPFLRGLFLEGLIFGGAYLRREICVSKSIGLALKLELNLPFLLCFTLYLRAIFQVRAPGGTYIWRGDLMEGFLRYRIGGLIFGGAYTRRGLFSEFYGISDMQRKAGGGRGKGGLKD